MASALSGGHFVLCIRRMTLVPQLRFVASRRRFLISGIYPRIEIRHESALERTQ